MEMHMIFVLLVLIIGKSAAVEKEWLHTTLWTDATNWNPPRLPCADGSAILKDGVVFVSNGSFPSQIIFSQNTEVIFSPNAEILLGLPINHNAGSVQDKCGPTEFSPKQRDWHNPMNWKGVDINPSPFIERVPCHGDNVIFPAHNSFTTTISQSTSVKSVTLNGKKITNNANLQATLLSSNEKDNFVYKNQATFGISNTVCPAEGCTCEVYSLPQYRKLICESFQCPPITCQNQVRLKDDCCFSCGAILEYDYNTNFNMMNCRNSLKNTYSSHVSRVSENRIQIFLSDTKSKPVTNEMLNSLTNLVQKSNHPCAAKIGSISKKTWSDFSTGNGDGGGSTNKTKIALAVVFPVFAILLVVIVVLFIRYRKSSYRPHEKFENEVEGQPTDTPEVLQTTFTSPYDHVVDFTPEKKDEDKLQGFSNPIFSGGFEDVELSPVTDSEKEEEYKVEEEDEQADQKNAKHASNQLFKEDVDTRETSQPPVESIGQNEAFFEDAGVENPLYNDIMDEMKASEKKEEEDE